MLKRPGRRLSTPDLFRLGASTSLNDVLMQLVKSVDRQLPNADYFSLLNLCHAETNPADYPYPNGGSWRNGDCQHIESLRLR